ncbi:MAG: wax ester/triacylglycerol synthase family O-acyltransferase [Actinobacteria bacterium]|nr:wax ester/triacylglycerol synthase family O-acyltransferase [Actinomycetota bacterium]
MTDRADRAATATGAHERTLAFSREMDPVDYLMLRGEHEPRGRSGMLSVSLLDVVPDFERLRLAYDRASRVVLRMRQRVVVPALPLASPQWIVDPDFDLSYHFRRVRLPEPGTMRQLLDFAAPIHAAPFDLARPLWEAYLVEGLDEEGAQAALVLKMNHAITDGVGGMEMANQFYDSARDFERGPLPPVPVPEDVTPTDLVREAVRRAPVVLIGGAIARSRRGAALAGRALRRPAPAIRDLSKLLGSAQRVFGGPPTEPSPLLRRRGLGRHLDWLEFPLDRLRRAGKAAGGSVNDAYIAGICGGLRRYHEAYGLPIDALPLAMPVNTRNDDDPAGGNRFAGAMIAAPVGEANPARRVARVRELVLTAVDEPAMNALSVIAPVFARVPAPMLSALGSMVSNVDVQASNIPGFPEAPYIAGAKIVKTVPFGPLPGVAIMIVMVSEGGMCYVGVNYDTAAVTDGDLFARCLKEGFDEVFALESERAPRASRRRTPAKEVPAS